MKIFSHAILFKNFYYIFVNANMVYNFFFYVNNRETHCIGNDVLFSDFFLMILSIHWDFALEIKMLLNTLFSTSARLISSRNLLYNIVTLVNNTVLCIWQFIKKGRSHVKSCALYLLYTHTHTHKGSQRYKETFGNDVYVSYFDWSNGFINLDTLNKQFLSKTYTSVKLFFFFT